MKIEIDFLILYSLKFKNINYAEEITCNRHEKIKQREHRKWAATFK